MGSFGSDPTSVRREHTAPLAEATRDVWDAILAVNLTGAFHTMWRALPH